MSAKREKRIVKEEYEKDVLKIEQNNSRIKNKFNYYVDKLQKLGCCQCVIDDLIYNGQSYQKIPDNMYE